MPISKNPLARYQKINYLLNRFKGNGKYISLKSLIEHCEVSKRTIIEDIKYMQIELEAPIDHSRRLGGYYYTEPYDLPAKLGIRQKELVEMKIAVKMLKQYQHIGLFENLERLQQRMENAVQFEVEDANKNHIYFEEVAYYQGLEYLQFLMYAIEWEKEITFEYHSYKDNKAIIHTVYPYAIKEHTNRWYFIGYNAFFSNFTTYAIDDRLKGETLKHTGNHFNRSAILFDINQHFKYTVGMTAYQNKPIEKVRLQFQYLQFKYFQSKPFHKYEKIKENPDKTVEVEMELRPNYELTRKIVSMGNGVKVLQPASLVKKVKDYLQDALDQYE